MTKHDEIIAALMDALELIDREAEKADASRHYISGVASQAMANCNAHRERNRDGYLVVATARKVREACTRCDGDGFGPNYLGNCERCGGSGKELR